MDYHDNVKSGDAWFYDDAKNTNIISLNGSGRSGKTTLASRLSDEGFGIHTCPYLLRDRFEGQVYEVLERTPEQRNIEVFGIGSLGWMIAEFHWRIKEFLNKGETVILDHYLADYMVEILSDLKDIFAFQDFIRHTKLPWFGTGHHFFLDIDYETYQSRSKRVDGKTELVEKNIVPYSHFTERRERYLKLCETEGLIRIDATTSIEETYNSIIAYITDRKKNNAY